MELNVNFFATLRRVTGGKTVAFDLPDEVTAGQVLDAVIERFPDMRADLLDENGQLHRHCHMFINGRGVPFLLEQMDTVIKPGDTVNIFPAVGGGEDASAVGGGEDASAWGEDATAVGGGEDASAWGEDATAVGGGEDTTVWDGGADATAWSGPVAGGSTVETETYVYGIPLWLLREYLEELGGTVCSDTMVAGDGWVAELTRLPDHQVGSLRMGRVEVKIEGDPAALAELRPGLDRKTLRAGG